MNQAAAPSPTVEATFHVEPHPDPIVQALINELLKLRKENDGLKAAGAALAKIAALQTLKNIGESRADDAGLFARDVRQTLKAAK